MGKTDQLLEVEAKSNQDGNLLILNNEGIPIGGYKEKGDIWFVWYRKDNQNYRIVMKSFTTKMNLSIKSRDKIKNNLKFADCEVGIGTISLKGKALLFKPEFEPYFG